MEATRICSVDGCGRPVNAREYCKRHYYRWSRYGDPLGQPVPRAPKPPKPKEPCTVEGCSEPQFARTWCENHYARWRRHGGLHDKRAERRDPVERFWEKVDKTTTPDGCWLWQGPPNGAGYGSFNLDGRVVGAHVAVLLLAGVGVPTGYEPDHLCRVPMCVRPDHLEVVTSAENKRRAWDARRGSYVP